MKNEENCWEKWIEELKVCPLFEDMEPEEILSFLEEVKPRITYFKKGQQMFKAGRPITEFGIFLNTEPRIEPKKCMEKWRSPNYFRPGWLFAELPTFSDIDRMPRDVFSEADCFVMFIEGQAFTGYSGSFRIYRILQRNMQGILARKCRVQKRSRAFFERKEISDGLYDCLLMDKKASGQDTFYESFSVEELAQLLMCSQRELKQAYDELAKKQLIVRTSTGEVQVNEKADQGNCLTGKKKDMDLNHLMETMQRDMKKAAISVNVLFISNTMLEPYMELYLKKYFAEINREVNYNYIKLEEIKTAAPELFEGADLVVADVNYECMIHQQSLSSYWDDNIAKKLREHINGLLTFLESKVAKGTVLMFQMEDFFLPQRQMIGNVCISDNVVDRTNEYLKEVSRAKNIVLLDTKRILSEASLEYAYSHKNRIRWDCIYSQSVIEKFAYEICKQYKVERRLSKKCIVLDCDNVLWGGVLSEIGADNIQLGNQGAGLAYKKFQAFVADLYNLGIVLVLCSKNDLEDIKEVFREHKEMVLKEDDISYFAVGWENKTKGILEASQYLNLSLDSMVFVDDSIAEIKEVQAILPDVECVLFDVWNPFKGFRDLFHLPYQVDKRTLECRRNTYKTNALREKQRRNHIDYDKYLKSLDTRLKIQRCQRNELSRISMLLLRTNKCSNGKRYSAKELEQIFHNEDYEIYAVYAKDCFSDLGLVGAMIVYGKKHLNAFSLSCRVLGRGLEQQMLAFLASNYEMISYDFYPTEKNEDLKKLLKKHFSDSGDHLSDLSSEKSMNKREKKKH